MKAKRKRGAWRSSGSGVSTTAIWAAFGLVLAALGMQYGAVFGGPFVANRVATGSVAPDGSWVGVQPPAWPVANDPSAPPGEGYFEQLVTLIALTES